MFSILFGSGLVVFRNRFARSAMASGIQLFKLKESGLYEESAKWTAVVFGLVFVVIGIIGLVVNP
ncbi:hypothetical protein [Streptomyces bohaiensis]|uniref:hypothetical protein n=1 Tax=Streptomyces bohaiensis TaxID=1431344 RepID=UPI003B7B6573